MLSKEQREVIRARDKARAQGEWKADHEHPMFVGTCHAVVSDDFDFMVGRNGERNVADNTAFIAACSVDIPNLLDTCDELERALESFYSKLLNYECIVKSTGQRVRHKDGCFYCGLVDEMEATLTRLTAKPSGV